MSDLSMTPTPGEPRFQAAAADTLATSMAGSPASELAVALPAVADPLPAVADALPAVAEAVADALPSVPDAARLRPVAIELAKRGFDIVVSALLLLVLLPVLAVVALLVRLDSPGPAFFRCDRVGYRGRRLRMLKFRKMRCDVGTRPLTLSDDERFTRLG